MKKGVLGLIFCLGGFGGGIGLRGILEWDDDVMGKKFFLGVYGVLGNFVVF